MDSDELAAIVQQALQQGTQALVAQIEQLQEQVNALQGQNQIPLNTLMTVLVTVNSLAILSPKWKNLRISWSLPMLVLLAQLRR
jgi:hypothetical protein